MKPFFLIPPSPRALLLAAAALSAAMLGGALIAQYGFRLYPCELCMAQRYPYMAVIALALPAAFLVRSPRGQWYAGLTCGLLFLLDAGIAAYHAAVEKGIIKGPDACTGTDMTGKSLEEMRQIIEHAALVSCNQPQAYILGLSLAAWNAVFAFLLAVAVFIFLLRLRTCHD